MQENEIIKLMRRALQQTRALAKSFEELNNIDHAYVAYGLDNEDLKNDTENILDILGRKIKRLEFEGSEYLSWPKA